MNLIPGNQKTTGASNFGLGGMKSQGISIYGNNSPKISFFSGKVIFSLLAVILALAAWGGLKGYCSFVLEKKLSEISAEVASIETGVDSAQVERLVNLDKSILLANNLLGQHIYTSKFLDLFQEVSLPLVQWKDLFLKGESGQAEVSGKTVSFSMLARQIVSFESSKFEAEITDVTLGENGIEFSAILKFDPKLLLRQ